MTDRIEPALTPEEWARQEIRLGPNWWDAKVSSGDGALEVESGTDPQEGPGPIRRLPALIALANAALPDHDARKITRERIDVALQAVDARWIDADAEESGLAGMLIAAERFLHALESYLPPE